MPNYCPIEDHPRAVCHLLDAAAYTALGYGERDFSNELLELSNRWMHEVSCSDEWGEDHPDAA